MHIRILAAASLLVFGLGACAPSAGNGGRHVRTAAEDEAHPGKRVYQDNCASCHDNPEQSRAPGFESLRQLNRSTIKYALELGYMQQQAKHLTDEERAQIIDWLPRDEGANDDWIARAECPVKLRQVILDNAPRTAVSFGIDDGNNRNMSAKQAGLSKADMPKLELAWAVAFPNTPTMRSQPVVVGQTVFLATTDSARVYALDVGTGCVKWVYKPDLSMRSSLAFADATPTSPAMVLAGDAAGFVHAIDAKTGKLVWKTDVKVTSLNRVTGAPVVKNGVVFAPLSAIEVNYTSDDAYECCKGQGALAALDLATGKKLWTGRTMEDAKPVLKGRTGTQQWGPSGAIIWSTPIVDAKRGLLYAGTGENTSWPGTDTSDSIVAFDMKTGERRWVFQATKADLWNYACGRKAANCDWPGEYHSPDWDFGATSMLAKRPDGKEIVVAGQKSGVVWALDPDDNGKLLWSNRLGRGGGNGGIHWGMAYDGKRIYAPLNDVAPMPDLPNSGAGVLALDVMTGDVDWSYKPNALDCGDAPGLTKAAAFKPEVRITPISAPMMPPPRQKPVVSALQQPPRPTVVVAGRNLSPVAGVERAPARPVTQPVAPAAAPAPAAAAAPDARTRCRVGMSAAPMLVDGALVTGTLQGMLRIFDGETGQILFEYMTNRPYDKTANGVAGHGGGLDSAPYVAGAGTLFVQSGYARFGEPPGNMLLAFRPKK